MKGLYYAMQKKTPYLFDIVFIVFKFLRLANRIS